MVQGTDDLSGMHNHVGGVLCVNVFAGLRFDGMKERRQLRHRHGLLSAIQGGLGGIEFGKQVVGHTSVVNMAHLDRMNHTSTQGLNGRLRVRTCLTVTGKHRRDK